VLIELLQRWRAQQHLLQSKHEFSEVQTLLAAASVAYHKIAMPQPENRIIKEFDNNFKAKELT
jgi:hypothetical protein